MRKLTKLLIPALVLVAVVMAFSVVTVSAAEAVQLEWNGGTADEAVALLDKAMTEAEADKDVVVTLKADMVINYDAKTLKYVGTDATTDKVVTITSALNGDSRYKLTVGANATVVFKGSVTFADIALAGANAWSSGGAFGVAEGKLTVADSVIMKAHTLADNGSVSGRSSESLNVFGVNIELNTGSYYIVAGNYYKTGVTVNNPVITVQGNAYVNTLIGRQHDLGGGNTVTGTSTVNILENASVQEVTAGVWQGSASAGDGVLNMNTTGRVSTVYLMGNNNATHGNFDNGGTRSKYTMNVLGGQVYGVYLYTASSGTCNNFDATFNFGNATYNSGMFLGLYEKSATGTGGEWGACIKDGTVTVNVTGGTFKGANYFGSRFEYTYTQGNGPFDAIDRVINISGGTFESTLSMGSYAKYGAAPHQGDAVINITGGTFKNMVWGGSRMPTSAGAHSGDIDFTISGGTFANHITAGSYMSTSTASHTGKIVFTIDGTIKQTGGRTMGGSVHTAGDHKGDVTVILNNSGSACSFAYGIAGGSYLDGATAKHTGSTEIIVKGSADWNTTIYGGCWTAYHGVTVCPEETPRTAKVILDSTYTGDVATIIAGSWYNTSSSEIRHVKESMDAADYTVEVNGGLVSSIIGHSTSYTGNKTPGTTAININKGTVFTVEGYANADTSSKIIINVAATATRVPAVKGYRTGVVGDNVYLNYDRTVTRDDEISYIKEANITVTGEEKDQPAVFTYTLYVANVSKGLGDGSSPENAIGHDADYYDLRAQALWYIKENGGSNSGLVEPAKSLVANFYKKNALYKAMTYKGSRILAMGGTIVVCDVLTIDATDAMRKSLADFWAGGISSPSSSKAGHVTITSLDPNTGIDYRWQGARLVLDCADLGLTVNFASPTTIDHLTIEHRYNSANGKSIDNLAIMAGMGNKFEIGYDVFVWCNDINSKEDSRVDLYPSLLAGHRYSDTKKDNYISVGSGTWATVVGGDWGSTHTGNATIAIDGSAKVTTVCGTTKATNSNAKHVFDGSCWIGLWGGEVDNVYVVAKPGMIWGDASVGVGGTKINGKVRATHPDYAGDPIQGWAFNYTDAQLEEGVFVGFDNPVPETGSNLAVYAIVAAVSLLGAAVVISVKRKAVEE